MRVALVEELDGIDSVELGERPAPTPAAGQALVRVHGAGVGPWDVGFVSGAASGRALPFVPGFEVAGVVEAVGDGIDVRPGDRVYGNLWPVGGGFAELALASVDRLARLPDRARFEEAAGLVIGGGTAYEGLVDRARLRAGETVLITAAAGGVGSVAVQIAAAVGARPLGVASARNHDYLRGLGAGGVFDYHAADWVQQVLAAVPGASTCCWTAPAARPTTKPSVRCARAAGRSSWDLHWGLPPSWSGASRANRSALTSTGSGWRCCADWSMRASCAPRSRRCCRWSRCARRCGGSRADTRAASSCSRSGSSCRRTSRPIAATEARPFR